MSAYNFLSITDVLEAALRRVAAEARCSRLPDRDDGLVVFQFGWPHGDDEITRSYFTMGEIAVRWFDYIDPEGRQLWTPLAGWHPFETSPVKWWDRATLEAIGECCNAIEEWYLDSFETPLADDLYGSPPDDWNPPESETDSEN